MSPSPLHLVAGSDPDDEELRLRLRARIATDIASGTRIDRVLDDLISGLSEIVPGSTTTIVHIDDRQVARIRASNAHRDIQRLIHGTPRPRWFGAWWSALSTHGPVVVPDVAASSLYREHRQPYIDHGLRAVRAVPISGNHNRSAGALAFYLPEARIPNTRELAMLAEVTSLAELAIRHDDQRQELLDRIRHDPLTGLENRDGIEDGIQRALDAAAGHGGSVGLLFVDIDDLTLVNDSLGHTVGDTIIATTAERIRNQLLPGDTVVRFGGDEFIVVLERIEGLEEAGPVAERIRDAIGETIRIDTTDLITPVSIGITTGRPGDPPLQLIDEGHAAVVRAKQSGRGSTATHDRGLDTGAGERLDREVRLREALDNAEFVLHWQPKVALATGRIVGAEALVRWDHPELGIIGPERFISTAERAGLINELSDQVLWQAVREVGAFAAIDPDFSAAINLSASQLLREEIVDIITEALRSYRVDPGHLIIELTESTLASGDVVPRLHDLRELGVRVAIDDFGTGYSSLAYVQRLPIEMVKIDRAFVSGLTPDGHGAPVLRAAVAMAQALELSTTVEGVESEEQLVGLRHLGVDWAQGYLFAEPGPQATVVALMLDDETW